MRSIVGCQAPARQEEAGLRVQALRRRRCWLATTRQVLPSVPSAWPGQQPEFARSLHHKAHGQQPAASASHCPSLAHAAPITTSTLPSTSTDDTSQQPNSQLDMHTINNWDARSSNSGSDSNAHTSHHIVLQPSVHLVPDTASGHDNIQHGNLSLEHHVFPNHSNHITRAIKSGAWLMKVIKARNTVAQLLAVLQCHGEQFNMMHASAALTHAVQLQQRQQQQGGSEAYVAPLPPTLTVTLMHLQLKHLHEFQARQVANSLWALSKHTSALQQAMAAGPAEQHHQHCAEQQQAEQLQQQVWQGLLVRLQHVVHDMRPQELANSWYAMACVGEPQGAALLPLMLGAASRCWHDFKPQELSNMLWATAQLPGISNSPMWATWVTGLLRFQEQVAHTTNSHELSGSLWAGARLRTLAATAAVPEQQNGHSDSVELWHSEASTTSHNMHHQARLAAHSPHNPESISHDANQQPGQIQSHHLRQVPATVWLSWSSTICTCLLGELENMGGIDLVQALSALPTLPRSAPHHQLATDMLRHAAMLASRNQLTPRAAASVLHAAADLGLRPTHKGRAWVHILLRTLLAGQPNVNQGHVSNTATATPFAGPADLVMALYGLAQMRCQPSTAATRLLLAQTQMQLEAGYWLPGQVAMLLWSCAMLQLRLPGALLAAFQKASYSVREQLAAREMAALFWGLGRLRLRPGRRWLQDVLGCVWRRREEFKTRELLHVVAGLGRMRHTTGDQAYDQLVSELQRRFARQTTCSSMQHEALTALCALAQAQPTSNAAMHMAQDLLLPGLTAPKQSLQPPQLVRLLWALARLARMPPHVLPSSPDEPWAPPDAAAGGTGPCGQDIATTLDDLLSPDGPEPVLDCAAQFELDWFLLGRGRRSQHDGLEAEAVLFVPSPDNIAGMAGSSMPIFDSSHMILGGSGLTQGEVPREEKGEGYVVEEVAHDAQDVVDALVRGVPAGKLLRGGGRGGNSSGEAVLLLQWQPLRKRAGRFQLSEPSVRMLLRSCLTARGRLSLKELAVVLYAMPQLNVRPSRTWVTRMLFERRQLLGDFSHHELALVLFALGCMRMRPPQDWMKACLQQVIDRAPYLTNGSLVSGVVRGLSMLDWSPGPLWMSQFIHNVTPTLRRMRPRQLATVYRASVDLEPRLAASWGQQFSTLLCDDQAEHNEGEGLSAAD